MGVLFKPPQQRFLLGGAVPKIDRSHALAQGLVGCWVPGVALGVDLTGNCPDLTYTNNSGIPSTAMAEGACFGGNATLSGFAPASWKGNNNFSMYYRADRNTGNATGNFAFFNMSYDSASSSPFVAYNMGDTGGSSLTSCGIQWNQAGSLQNSAQVDLSALKLLSILGTFAAPSGNAIFYSGGLQQNSTAFGGGAVSTTATSQITINGFLELGWFQPALCYIACAWNRILSADEAVFLDANPYCFLQPAEGEWPALFLSAAGGFKPYWAIPSNLPVIGAGTY